MTMEDESQESDEDVEDEVPAAAPAYEEEDEPAPVFDNIFEIMAQNPFIEDGSE